MGDERNTKVNKNGMYLVCGGGSIFLDNIGHAAMQLFE